MAMSKISSDSDPDGGNVERSRPLINKMLRPSGEIARRSSTPVSSVVSLPFWRSFRMMVTDRPILTIRDTNSSENPHQ